MAVSLRPLRAEDGETVLAWRNSAAVAPYMYSEHRITPAEHAAWLARALEEGGRAEGDRRFWIIELDAAGVGLANLAKIDRANSKCEWAYYLADPATRGRGVGSVVEWLVLAFVFERLGLNRLWCEVLVENEAVWGLHERFGFVREALLRAHVRKAGVFRDVVGLGMLSADWPAARAAALARLAEKRVSVGELEAALAGM
ncbi:UDP-4-amino-4,6-dideoxy-N-acetyl-beta-L-altrosamine N-acetyltransferase [Caulobacter sp. NIBR1757]|uniref:UDP-4-amino-4, 6-dideoxy-N-acetyl-beta-L-altrosamine N-acetyltransferase n=1 Tax=Caulobacter sp. NIBR1757 TaxID=3016000 RepID=UPI0022F02082|nr:UDP-4-amino-4,6-dideoxy-N-acetyl-beta-L-altrosamine N-acetyltransferase [Caulobacter sp. NIBR1757]WGM38566.1 Spermidine N(1)-acetyltransferase [Caulobacter sp. NIBR1757]